MKIIGSTKEGVLISATRDEVANLVGYYSSYSNEMKGVIEPGREIMISSMYSQLRVLSEKKDNLEKLAAELRIMADALTVRSPIFDSATREE